MPNPRLSLLLALIFTTVVACTAARPTPTSSPTPGPSCTATADDDPADDDCPGESAVRHPAGGLPQLLPTPGPVRLFEPPSGPGVRVDTGVLSGSTVPGSFDSLMAKLIVTGATRAQAIARARRALSPVIGQIHGQVGHDGHEEDGPADQVARAHPQVRDQRL